MLLATGLSFEFIKFLQVIGWIILPVSLIAIIVTVVLHYRKKRAGVLFSDNGDEVLLQASPELMGYTRGDGEYVFFDHSALIGDYKKRLSYNHAKYTALKYDFEKLQTKYTDLSGYAVTKFLSDKTSSMENNHAEMPKTLQAELTTISSEYKAEKEALFMKLEEMKQANKRFEEENQSLRDEVTIYKGTDEETAAVLSRWKEQQYSLQEKVAEQQYLQEVVEEKKAQIVFLQNQLESRIRSYHLLEQQRTKLNAELEEEKQLHQKTFLQLDSLKAELMQKQEEVDKAQVALCGKEEELILREQQFSSKTDQVTWLENVLLEAKQHNEVLHAVSADDKNVIASLQDQFSSEQSRVQYLEQKLVANKQLLQRLHKDLSLFMEEEIAQPPVISLRPEYNNQESEAFAAQ